MIRVFGWQTSTFAEHDFRIGMPFPLLDSARFEASFGTPGRDIFDYDVVFAHRLAGDAPLWHKLCADPNILCVYDMDDDLLCVDPANSMPYRIFAPLAADTRRNVEAADVVTVPNAALAERYRFINPNVTVLPICIPDDMPDWPIPERPHLTVGWAGSMHKAQDWAQDNIAGKLTQFARLAPDARFKVMGGDYTRGLLGARCEHELFTEDVNGYYRALDFSVGINPLMRSKFNDGKSHTKLIEYGARGIPCVTSPYGQNREWVRHGVNGLLVEDPSDWVPYLLMLCDDEARADMARAAHESASDWRISQHVHLWEDVFAGVTP